jgi:ADP-heptose:LPS heptosyltransferase
MTDALVVHPGALGDVLLAVPALRALRAAQAQLTATARITIAAQPQIGALLVALGIVDHAVVFDTLGLDALFTDAPLGDAPVAAHLARAGRVVCWFGARDAQFAGRVRGIAPDAVVALPASPPGCVWEHLLRTVGGRAHVQPIFVAPDLVERGCEALLAIGWDGRSRVLVLHPGSGGVAKRWPTAGFIDAIKTIDATVVVHQGPADGEVVERLVMQTRRPVLRLFDPALPTLAGVLAAASAYLGNDSGVSHLAAAVGAPSVVLFTDAMLPWVPWSSTARCLTVTTTSLLEPDRRAVGAALGALP